MKKVFILFMSHRSGEHGLTIHNTIEEVKFELKCVIDVIKDNSGIDEEEIEAAYKQDNMIADSINDNNVNEYNVKGFYAELSDSTWFDIFVREV